MHALTVSLEVEERRQETAIGEASVWVTELIKERMHQSIQLHEHQNIALDIFRHAKLHKSAWKKAWYAGAHS
jgi:hypothetical protein